jgi:hypothetical protein
MSTQEKDDVVVSTVTPNGHTEAAQARLQELRQSRARIPYFTLPISAKESAKLAAAASVPPQFVEISASAMGNEKALERPSVTPEEVRELMSYADAYGPLADEHEAMSQFLRHSINAARNLAGSEALATYHAAKRLAKIPRYAGLAVYVADMRRALGKVRGKETAEQLAKRADKAVAKAKAAKAKEQAALKPHAPEPAGTTE